MDGVAIDLWLDWQNKSQPTIVVPYAKARAATVVEYRIILNKEGSGGRSHITQGGTLVLPAEVATPLSRLSVSHAAQDSCAIEVRVRQNGEAPIVRSFGCAP